MSNDLYKDRCSTTDISSQAPSVDGWLPIEAAPRDGTDFLALVPFRQKHHQMVGCFAPSGKFVSWPMRLPYEPTHWQPLPGISTDRCTPAQVEAQNTDAYPNTTPLPLQQAAE